MPMPVSLTDDFDMRVDALEPHLHACRRGRVNFTAFDSRFHSTCCSRSGSPDTGPALRIEHRLEPHALRIGRRRARRRWRC